MADLIKLFDFRMQEGIKNDYKPFKNERSLRKEKEKNVQEPSGNSFGKALETVSEAIQNKEISEKPKPVEEISGDKNLKDTFEKKEEQVKELVGQLNLLLNQLKKLNPNDKKIEKLDIIAKEPVSLDNLIKLLTQLVQSLGIQQNQSIQNSALKPAVMDKDSLLLVQGMQKGLGQLKELLAAEPQMGKEIMAAVQNGTIQLSRTGKEDKERRIFDVKIEKGVLKNSEKKEGVVSKDSQKIETLAQSMGDSIQAKEFKEKLQSEAQNLDSKNRPAPKKEVIETTFNQNDKELNLNKKENESQLNFQQTLKAESMDKMGRVDGPKNVEKARRADLGREIISQIGEKVSGFIGKNQSQIIIQLRPEELGNVKIMLEMKNDVIKGRIVVENNEVKDILQENINQVKSVLQDSGIQLGELEVSTQQGSGQSFEKSLAEDLLQKTIARNQRVNSFFSDLKAYEDGNYVSVDYMNGGSIFLEA